jgi:hypothetical protein
MTTTATRQEDKDLAVLDTFEQVYKAQHATISRRLLGGRDSTDARSMTYYTKRELESIKDFAESIGLNVSTLTRLTMTTLAASHIAQPEYEDLRQTD